MRPYCTYNEELWKDNLSRQMSKGRHQISDTLENLALIIQDAKHYIFYTGI